MIKKTAVTGGPFDYTGKNWMTRISTSASNPKSSTRSRQSSGVPLEYYNAPELEKEQAMAAFIAHEDEVTTGYRMSQKE